MKVSYLSDVHLEFGRYPSFQKEEGGDVLILAGDILTAHMISGHRTDADSSKLKKYLLNKFKPDLTDKYKHVLYCMGNHEHYNYIYRNTFFDIQSWLISNGFDNVRVMENDTTVIDGVRFIGATLWTDYDGCSPLSMRIAYDMMNDYKVIGSQDVTDMNYFNRNDNRKITPEFILQVHTQSRDHIRLVASESKEPVVVFTHHPPSFQSCNSLHSGNSLDGAYATNLSNMILDTPQIKYWISGHTHMSCKYEIGGCQVLSNQLGYYFQSGYKAFKGTRNFEI
jgi:predicted phosphodiesterase